MDGNGLQSFTRVIENALQPKKRNNLEVFFLFVVVFLVIEQQR